MRRTLFLVWGSSPTPRWPCQGERLLAGPVDAEPGPWWPGPTWGALRWLPQEAEGERSGGRVAAVVVGRGGAGCVSCCFALFFDVVVDVTVVQVGRLGIVQLLDKVVLPVLVQDMGFGPDSAARGVPQLQFLNKLLTCPLLRRQVRLGAVLGPG